MGGGNLWKSRNVMYYIQTQMMFEVSQGVYGYFYTRSVKLQSVTKSGKEKLMTWNGIQESKPMRSQWCPCLSVCVCVRAYARKHACIYVSYFRASHSLTLILDVGEWPALSPTCFPPRERTYWRWWYLACERTHLAWKDATKWRPYKTSQAVLIAFSFERTAANLQ